jgi:organic radical activating enzyme
MFSGIQGEGPFVGVRQVFVRFGGCDLRCWWCDTPRSLVRRDPGRYETAPGSREFEVRDNPVTLTDAASMMVRLLPEKHHSVTFTGGEPLLQPESVRYLAKAVRERGARTYLETHGGRVRELEEVIDVIDIVSMDIKLASSTGEHVDLEIHAAFLEVALQASVFAKIVITPDTFEGEVIEAAQMMAHARGLPPELILQPVTPFGRIKEAPSPDQMLRLQELCLGVHPSVRVIPQTHKLIGQM